MKLVQHIFIMLVLFSSAVSAQDNSRIFQPPCPDTVSAAGPSSLAAFANVFSPNNDGFNDAFGLTGAGLTDVQMIIYDRWGTKVYEFVSRNDAWDGRNTSGEACSSGVYFFFFTANGVDGISYKESGTIQLFR